MKEPTFAAAYCAFYPVLSEIARACGYALAIHGSIVTDFDLIAIPWTNDATDAEHLVTVIAQYAGTFDRKDDLSRVVQGPELKKHGRKAWSILIGNGAVIDFSVMPKV